MEVREKVISQQSPNKQIAKAFLSELRDSTIDTDRIIKVGTNGSECNE